MSMSGALKPNKGTIRMWCHTVRADFLSENLMNPSLGLVGLQDKPWL